jgi:hypothetical protein
VVIAQSANTINGWLRDFLWAQSSQVIQSYGSALSAYGLIFLGAHFIWAFSLMFLFSGRGYWQELIESIVWAHNKQSCSSYSTSCVKHYKVVLLVLLITYLVVLQQLGL